MSKKFLILILFMVVLTGCYPKHEAQVLEVIDGDTIKVLLNGEMETVRYIGINTPEWNEPLGSKATLANASLTMKKTVVLERDKQNRDVYGRLLRYVYVDGALVNQRLVELNVAEVVSYPPNTRNQAMLYKAE